MGRLAQELGLDGSGRSSPAVRDKLASLLARAERKARRTASGLAGLPFSELPPREAVRMVYNVMLRRDPDEGAWDELTGALATGQLSLEDVVDRVRCSNEYRAVPVRAVGLHDSLHASRCEFIIGLPPARRIVDLGGGHTVDPRGAMVVLGYPYDFEELVVVDLPPEDRHPLYHSETFESGSTDQGVVRYEYRSMTDLGFAADSSVDLVYSGQSIEHVTEADGDVVLAEAFRILEPGGHLALDTPNGRVCRLQQPTFIDPDHKVEYTLEQLRAKVSAAGFDILTERGLNWGGRSVASGRFDAASLAAHRGIYHDAESCYLLALLCQKPAD